MTVSIETRINSVHLEYSTAVSSVSVARQQLSTIKRTNKKAGWLVIAENRNSLLMENGSGDQYSYQIIKYFTKEPL